MTETPSICDAVQRNENARKMCELKKAAASNLSLGKKTAVFDGTSMPKVSKNRPSEKPDLIKYLGIVRV